MGPSVGKFPRGVVGMRRGETRAHPCFYFIDDSLGGGNLLFESAKVPRRPELIKSDVKQKTRNKVRFGGLAIPREAMSEKKK